MGLVGEICGIAATDNRPLALGLGGYWSKPGIALAGGGGAVIVDGGLVVVADTHFDNRPELAHALAIGPGAPDGAVIAAAYRKWGLDCPARIEGAFAFALWDPARRRLLCARDLMGIRPLFYRHEGTDAVHFAQSASALTFDIDRTSTLRDEAIADFLYGRVLDAQGTWFAGVERLPAGHSLVFERGELRLLRHSHITPAASEPGGDEPATLRTLLDSAVARRVEGSERVGALLSGGLDSSSIACLLRDQRGGAGNSPLPVFSMMFREPERANERRHLDAVLATGGFEPHVLDMDGYAPLAGFEKLLAAMGGPTLSPNLACMGHVVALAAQRGVSVLLDGHGGDEVVSHGYGLLNELAASGAWLSLLHEARGAADNYGRSRLVLTRRVAGRQKRLDARIIAKLLAPFDYQASASAQQAPIHLLARDFVHRSRLSERLRGFAKPDDHATEQAQHLAALSDPLQPYAFEVHAAFMRSMGAQARYPFWDRQVVEFCLGLPAREKLSRGWSRLVLRRAMAGVVPDSILQRRDKVDFTVHLARGLVRHHNERILDLLGSTASPLAPYVDLARARAAYAAIAADPDAASGRTVQMVWRAAALGLWLEMGYGAQSSGAVRLREVAA